MTRTMDSCTQRGQGRPSEEVTSELNYEGGGGEIRRKNGRGEGREGVGWRREVGEGKGVGFAVVHSIPVPWRWGLLWSCPGMVLPSVIKS